MILEGVVTSTNADGGVNIAPMGPAVDQTMSRLVLRPFQTSCTFKNLKRNGEGVFHVVDDVELLARAAINRFESPPPVFQAESIAGWILADSCRWYTFRIVKIDERLPRAEMIAQVVDQARVRDFFGFNRAKHAVVEAAILATRVSLLDPEVLIAEFGKLRIIVEKTGADQEHLAFALLEDHVHHSLAEKAASLELQESSLLLEKSRP